MPIAPNDHDASAHAHLIHRLGGEAWVVPVPAGLPHPIQEVGRLGSLPCWSFTGPLPEARLLARQLARRGSVGLLVSDDPGRGLRALAVTIAPVRCHVFPWAADHPLGERRLAAARLGDAPPLAAAVRAADALDVDAAGRRAFGWLRQALEQMVEALPSRVPREERHGWALLQATRLLFLRFVESEGWLDARSDFLRCAVDHVLASRRDPGRHLLHPLFFGTLNRRPRQRSRLARSFGSVPFLNGGLFEPHILERGRRWHLPRDHWITLFTLVVDRIEVTLDPETLDGRVTPELLGRVFEGVMDPIARRDTGAFYTPPELVRAVVREALAHHLASRLGTDPLDMATALDDPDPHLQRLLLDLRVLDPAVGSGAFLVGALDLLHGPGPRDPGRVRHLVTRRLHGVDRHPGAVRLTELRLWLEALRAMRGRAPDRVAPLPNLDTSIRAGDSLLDPLHGHPLAPRAGPALAACRRAVIARHGAEKRTALRALRTAERRVLADALEEREAVLAERLRDIDAGADARTLFGDVAPPARALTRQSDALRRALRAVRSERRALARDASAAPFAMESAFAPILTTRQGFDLVLGNPPWVRAERLEPPVRTALEGRYRWWRGSGRGYRHQPDLAVAFLERGMELLTPSGTLAYLMPSKLLTADYARVARDAVARQHTVHCVADLTHDPRAGFEATTYPMAVVISRARPANGHRIRCGFDATEPTVAQSEWSTAVRWSVVNPVAETAVRRLAVRFPSLAASHPAHLGVKTGANAVFLDPPAALHEWTRPAIRGRDVGDDGVAVRHCLLWPCDRRGEPWDTLPPALAAHLAPHRTRLEQRADAVDGRWWRLFRTEAATAPHRVVWPDLARELRATARVPRDAVPLNSCYVIATQSAMLATRLAAWLRTIWIRRIAAMGAEVAAGGHRRFGARTVGSVPLPPEVVDGRWRGDHERDASAAALLGLTTEEQDALRELAPHSR